MTKARLKTIEDIPEANAVLAEQACRKLRLHGEGLEQVVKKSKMPTKLREELHYAIEVEHWLDAPKLARQIDIERVQNAHTKALKYLKKADPKRERERRWLGVATVIVVNMTIFFSLLAMFIRGQA